MENTFIKLSQLMNSYTVFEENQVLTSEQLNGITAYLDRQHRLTRVKLFGVGVVCGLNVRYDEDSLTITRGCAVTSDGDLVWYDQDMVFPFFEPFTDKNANYPYFISSNNQIPLFELLAAPEGAPQAKPLDAFDSATGKSLKEDMAVLLYLESYVFDPDICTGDECDNKGQSQQNALKALLVSKSDLEDFSQNFPSMQQHYHALEDFALERVLFEPENIENPNDLVTTYQNVINRMNDRLKNLLTKSYAECQPLLESVYNGVNPTQGWINTLSAVTKAERGVQYVYDLLKDIGDTYNEFKEALFDNTVILCCPDITLFPKHIMLGGVTEDAAQAYDPYRHQFYPSPVLAKRPEQLQKVQFLHKRLDALIKNFQIPAGNQSIKITPSRSLEHPLSEKAIPYYYKVDQPQLINEHWNYELSLRRKNSTIYSYSAEKYGGAEHARKPLQYSTSEYPFFRIEGHVGKTVEEVEKVLQQIIAQHHLPINVISLQIEKEVKTVRYIPRYGYKDLKALHLLYRKDLQDNLNNLKAFNSQLDLVIQDAVAKEELPPKADITDPKISFGSYSQQNTTLLENKIQTLNGNLKKSYRDFDREQFDKEYEETQQLAANVNKSVRGVTYASAFTPYETLLNDSRFKLVRWIDDIIKKREEKTKELGLFAKFFQEHPGMEHLAGVERGGTFILVYSSKNNHEVVADFALPYWYYEMLKDEKVEEEPIEEEETPKRKWTDFNDFIVYLDKKLLLEKQITDLEIAFDDRIKNLIDTTGELEGRFTLYDKKFDVLDSEIRVQKDSLNVYSGSLDSYIQNSKVFSGTTLPTDVAGYKDRGLGNMSNILEYLDQQTTLIDEKIEAGTATPDEVKMREGLDSMMGNIINMAVTTINSQGTDIAVGSEEERFINHAGNFAVNIKDSAAKEALSTSLQNITDSAGVNKENLANRLNNLLITIR